MKKPKTITITKKILTEEEADATTALRRVIIHHDSSPLNPREEYDNLFKIYSDCKYLSSDEGAENPVVDYGKSPAEAKFKKGVYALPVYAYVHSGMAISLKPFKCPWDSGVAGWIYVNKAHFCEEMGLKKFSSKRAYKSAEGEVEELNQYINGEVYGYSVETRASVEDEWEDTGDSCWGFSGDESIPEMVAEAGGDEEGTIVCKTDEVCYFGDDKVEMVIAVRDELSKAA